MTTAPSGSCTSEPGGCVPRADCFLCLSLQAWTWAKHGGASPSPRLHRLSKPLPAPFQGPPSLRAALPGRGKADLGFTSTGGDVNKQEQSAPRPSASTADAQPPRPPLPSLLPLEWAPQLSKEHRHPDPALSSSFHCLGFCLGFGFCRFPADSNIQPGLSSTTLGIHIAFICEMEFMVPSKEDVVRPSVRGPGQGGLEREGNHSSRARAPLASARRHARCGLLCKTTRPAPQGSSAAAAAADKSLQSCPTLCDPRDGSPPGSPVPGILQARTLEWVAISFSNA